MEALCGQSSGTPYDKAYAFYKKYFLGIKEYFPATLVNADAKRYELAKIAYDNDSYSNDTDPITQSHGDFYSAETAWIKKRIMYIMSKYNYGLFSANGTDTIIVRAAGDLIDYDITPAFDMYPAIANGTSIVQGTRTKAGETCRITIDLGGSADQQNAIQAASWLLSIGDWHKKNVSGTMVVRGRRLSELILGSKTDNVIISITGLTLADCGSMQKVLLSNITTLQGTLDLSTIINIREVYADGTNLSQIKLPNGGGLEVIEYPANNKYITFRNFPMLTTEGLRIGQCAVNITDFLIENCPLLKPVKLLSDIIEAQQSQGANHVLKHIRAVGFEEEYYSADALNMLANLADGTYEGLSAEGLAGEEAIPVLDGKVIVHSNYYQDFVNSLRNTFARLELVVEGEPAIYLADPVWREIAVSVWDIDKDGYIIENEANIAQRVNFSQYSNSNEIKILDMSNLVIDLFNYWSLLTGVKQVYFGKSNNYSNKLPYQCFMNNTSIELLDMGNYMLKTERMVCQGCTNLKKVILSKNLTRIDGRAFKDCISLEEVSDIPDTCTGIYGDYNGEMFRNCGSLKKLTVGSGITKIGWGAFRDCTAMESFYIKATTPPQIETEVFFNNPCNIYVPRASVDAYKTAANWSAYADRIYEYDF